MADSAHSDRVLRFASAPSLEALPEAIDVDAGTPPNPPQEIQQKFVGLSYEAAYSEAETFVKVVDEMAVKHTGSGVGDATRIIDFGSGWGRISRFLLGRSAPTHIHALDVDPEMTTLVNVTLPGVNAMTVDPFPPTVLGRGAFDLAVAFSVFSHLSGPAHEAWALEFARLVRPGGVAAITVLDGAFMGQVAGARAAVEAGEADEFATSLATTFEDVDAARAGFERGEIQYAGSGGGEVRTGDYYGWAAAPPAYVERVWGGAGFRIVEWVPANVLFPQALVILVRGEDSGAEPRPVTDHAAAAPVVSLPHRLRSRAGRLLRRVGLRK
ncbi:class I SAM-dependent methyltransferase [Occultella glacieicola]|uniref:Class I SAM-dependent methyltransferase n=1 Tax=Occultella glacieicola TaxID=2518684 RepID=A0ABY2E2U6_9MICO|nr:class I SAM-dependent methyltransferase [Occultella glacieicola]TDE93941.1 class I SAM-dependent methyltransferase [Occultella glacieicola]